MTGAISYRQVLLLERLTHAPKGGAMSFGGIHAIRCHGLVRKGLATHLGQTKSGESAFRITDEGLSRLALELERLYKPNRAECGPQHRRQL